MTEFLGQNSNYTQTIIGYTSFMGVNFCEAPSIFHSEKNKPLYEVYIMRIII